MKGFLGHRIRRLADACGAASLPGLKAVQIWHEGTASSDDAWHRPGALRDYLVSRLPPTAALWRLLELEDPVEGGEDDVRALVARGADVHWRHPAVCTSHGLPAAPLEYLCEGENFGWRYSVDAGWTQDCPEKWDRWLRVVRVLLAHGASAERFGRLALAARRPFAVDGLACADLYAEEVDLVATDDGAPREEVELTEEVVVPELAAPPADGRAAALARLGATQTEIEILRRSGASRDAEARGRENAEVEILRGPATLRRRRSYRSPAAAATRVLDLAVCGAASADLAAS